MDIPGYRIIDRLGQGGMATVYLAIQESFEREVALKVLLPELLRDPAFGERFLREAKIVSRLVHPNIVTVYDVGVQGDHHYLAMEYVPGKDLKVLRTKLTRAQALQVVKDIARALDYAARKGYVHRDVKPENIMIHEEDGRAVLMDFGIARPADVAGGMTQTGIAIGTPHYMSPEQAKGKPVDARSDIYSLGVVLFQLITGRVPFDADSAVAVGIKHVAEPIPRVQAAFAIFQPILNRVLAKNPDERYQTGAELVEDLNQIDDDDLRRVDELIELAVQQLPEADVDAPTVISAVGDTRNASAINDAQEEEESSEQARAQHWPQSGQGTPVQSIGATPSQNPFGASHWFRNLMLVAIIAVVSVFLFRQYLPAPWPEKVTHWHHAGLDYLRQQSLPLSAAQWDWLYGLGGATVPPGNRDAQLALDAKRDAKDTDHNTGKPKSQAAAGDLEKPVSPAEASSTTAAQADKPASGSRNSLHDSVLADTRPVLSEEGLRARAATPAPAASTPVPTPALAQTELAQQAAQLQAEMQADLAKAASLAEFYERLRLTNAGSDLLEAGEAWVRAFYESALGAAQQAGDDAAQQQLLDSWRAHFNLWADPERLAEMQAKLDSRAWRAARLAEAADYLTADALLSPQGANAVEAYRDVLAEFPQDADALAGLAAVADRYAALAQSKLNSGDWNNAKALAARGLTLDKSHPQLRQLASEAADLQAQQLAKQRQLATALSAAKAAEQAGNIFGAEGAAIKYQSVLALEPNHSQALSALDAYVEDTAVQIDQLLANKQFDQAQQTYAMARQRLPDHGKLQRIGEQLNAAVEAAKPRVDKVRIAASPPVTLATPQSVLTAVDRTLYIGLSFHNFETTAVVQAILMDGARSLQIAQVPVVISGRAGEKTFRIDRPVEGFADGGYNLDLMLDDQLLLSQHFQIDNP